MPITQKEKEVAEILVDLGALVLKFERRRRGFPFTWGCKRRRSAINVSPTRPPHHHLRPLPPPPFKGEVSSPATPLSFSPSESDDNNNQSLLRRNVSLKRKREHYLQIVEEITKDNELLQGEIQNVKGYLHRLKEFNLKLKAKKHELIVGPNSQSTGTAQPLPLIVNHAAGPPQICDARGQGTTSLGGASTSTSDVGPSGIPDLNMPFEEEEEEEQRLVVVAAAEDVETSRNLSRTMAAAQARHNRLQIQRVKNPIGSNKNRYSFR